MSSAPFQAPCTHLEMYGMQRLFTVGLTNSLQCHLLRPSSEREAAAKSVSTDLITWSTGCGGDLDSITQKRKACLEHMRHHTTRMSSCACWSTPGVVAVMLYPCGMAVYLTQTSAMPYHFVGSLWIGAAVMKKDNVDFAILQTQFAVWQESESLALCGKKVGHWRWRLNICWDK